MTTKNRKHLQPRRRSILSGAREQLTYLAVGLADLGLSTAAIADECQLTYGQVLYALKLFGVKRSGFRNGTSQMFGRIRKHYGPVAYLMAEKKGKKL